MKGEELVMLPGPVGVSHETLLAMATSMFSHRGPKFAKLYSDVREKLRSLLNTNGEVYFITSSGTGGVEFSASNLAGPGEKVVVCTNGFFAERLRDSFLAVGADVTEVQSRWGEPVDLSELEKRAEGAAIVAAVFNETSTGVVNQAKKIADIAHSKGALCLMDNISGVGNEYYMDPWNIDVTVLATQKGLATPPGSSFVVMSPEAREKARKTKKRSYYFNFDLYEKQAADLATPATPAISILYALNHSLDQILSEGVEKFTARHHQNAEAFRLALGALGLNLFANKNYASDTISAIKMPGNARKVVETMSKRFEVVVSTGLGQFREDVIRVGHMGRVDMKDIVTTVGALEMSMKLNSIGSFKLGDGVSAAMSKYLEQ